MPRTKFDQPKYPEIDWLMAAILERKRVMRLEWKDIALKAGGISGDSLRQLASKKAPEEWPKDVRVRVCKVLGIDVKMIVIGSPEDRRNDRGNVR